MTGGHMVGQVLASFLLLASFRRDEGAVTGDLRMKREAQFNSGQGLNVPFQQQQLPKLPSGPGSAQGLFEQIVRQINNGHEQQQDQNQFGAPSQIQTLEEHPHTLRIPQAQEAAQAQVNFAPQTLQRFPQLNSPLNSPTFQQTSSSKQLSPTQIIPDFTPDLSQVLPDSNIIQNLGLALFKKDPALKDTDQETPRNIFHALDAQLQNENRLKIQEQKFLEQLANKQRLQEIEQIRIDRIRQEHSFRIQEQRKLEERVNNQNKIRQEESFRIQEQRELEDRVNKQRLRDIEEQRILEFQEAKRRKELILIQDESFGLQEHLDERNRFHAHKAIANSFRPVNPLNQRISENVVIGLAGSRSGRFRNRPEPTDIV